MTGESGAANPSDGIPLTNRELGDLFTRHREHLRRMVLARVDDRLAQRIDASDVLQEAYLDAQQRLIHAEKMHAPPLVWLRQITEQTLIDLHRRHLLAECRAVGKEVPLDQPMPGMSSMMALAQKLAGSNSTPSGVLMEQERRQGLEKALRNMDALDREILVLRHFEELTNKEIAELLGLQPTAASNRYFRALQKLKQMVAEVSHLATGN